MVKESVIVLLLSFISVHFIKTHTVQSFYLVLFFFWNANSTNIVRQILIQHFNLFSPFLDFILGV